MSVISRASGPFGPAGHNGFTVKPEDFLEIDQLLSDEDRLLKETVSRYVKEKYLPGVNEHVEQGTGLGQGDGSGVGAGSRR